MADEMSKIKNQLALMWISHVLRESPLESIRAESLVDDGRKRDKTLRMLTEEGYIQREKPGTPLHPTHKAYDEVEAVRPDLIKKVFERSNPPADMDEYNRWPGVPYNDLTLGERKWVAEHAVQYDFFHFDWAWTQRGPQPIDRKDADAWFSFNKSVWLSDGDYRVKLEDCKTEWRFQRARSRNLAWGLEDQKRIDPVDKDIFAQSRDDDFFFGRNEYAFGHDPSKWEEELKKQVEACRDDIAALTRRANVLLLTQDKISDTGGWEAFLKAYDERIREELAKEKP